MFVRIAWQTGGRPKSAEARRRVRPLPRREADDLGIPPADFEKMTRGLFDPRI